MCSEVEQLIEVAAVARAPEQGKLRRRIREDAMRWLEWEIFRHADRELPEHLQTQVEDALSVFWSQMGKL